MKIRISFLELQSFSSVYRLLFYLTLNISKGKSLYHDQKSNMEHIKLLPKETKLGNTLKNMFLPLASKI